MATITRLTVFLLTTSLFLAHAGPNNTSNAHPIIVDTDMMTDCDDAGALAIANVFHNCGICDLRAVMINTHSEYGSLAASAINTYFGNGHIPIAALRPLTNETFFDSRDWVLSEYASKLAHNFPRTLPTASAAPDPLALYLATLAAAPPHSLTLLSLGFLTNLATLLSHPSGPALVAAKVRHVVIMGGAYPSGREYNFAAAPADTAIVLDALPPELRVTYLGYEVGKAVRSGKGVSRAAAFESPVRAAYEWYVGRGGTERESWDPLAVLYGVLADGEGWDGRAGGDGDDRGEGGWWGEGGSPFEYGNENGYNALDPDGANRWVEDAGVTNQHYLRLRKGVQPEALGRVLTGLYARGPGETRCGFGEGWGEDVAEDGTGEMVFGAGWLG